MATPKLENILPAELRNRLESSRESVAILVRGIKAGQLAQSAVCAGDPHSRLVETAKALSDSCTKLTLLFIRPPPPSLAECGGLCAKLDQATLSFVNASYSVLGVVQGVVYSAEVRTTVLTVLSDLDQLISTITTQGCTSSASQLHRTGSLWKSCEGVSKLSRDNLTASLKIYFSQLHLLRDALSEVTELESANGVSEVEWDGLDDEEVTEVTETLGGMSLGGGAVQGWTDQERRLVQPSIELIRLTVEVTECASRLLVRGGNVRCEGGVAEMDSGCSLMQQLSPAVDDLANEIGAPVAMDTYQSLAIKLGETLLSFVQTLSSHHYCQSTDRWLGDKFTANIQASLQSLKHSQVSTSP